MDKRHAIPLCLYGSGEGRWGLRHPHTRRWTAENYRGQSVASSIPTAMRIIGSPTKRNPKDGASPNRMWKTAWLPSLMNPPRSGSTTGDSQEREWITTSKSSFQPVADPHRYDPIANTAPPSPMEMTFTTSPMERTPMVADTTSSTGPCVIHLLAPSASFLARTLPQLAAWRWPSPENRHKDRNHNHRERGFIRREKTGKILPVSPRVQ